MHPSLPRRLRRLTALGIMGFSFAGAAVTSKPAVAEASSCAADAGTTATMTLAAVSEGTRCLLNVRRAAHGVKPLTFDRLLTRSARRHSRKMVAKRFFAHDSLSGESFAGRIADTGWMNGRQGWTVGENLAWGAGPLATPHAVVRSWMASAAHRRNVLDPRFRVIGIGVKRGTPVAGRPSGVTYTTDFGS